MASTTAYLKACFWSLLHITEYGHVAYKIESNEAHTPLKWSIFPFNGARIKVHLLQKEVTMFGLKG